MCSNEYDATGLEKLTMGETGVHIPLNPDAGSHEKKGVLSRRGQGISEEEDLNFSWRGLERLSGRDTHLITVVSTCLKLAVYDSCAPWGCSCVFREKGALEQCCSVEFCSDGNALYLPRPQW